MDAKRNKTLSEISKYCSVNSLLIITKEGKLIRLSCPFQVQVVKTVWAFQEGDRLTVLAVKISPDLKLVYMIKDRGYYHYCFMIL
jgi:hypothetical protein